MNKIISDKLVKEIYKSEIKDYVILEGSYAVYVALLNNYYDEDIYDRVLTISDIDVDVFKTIESLWNSNNGDSEELYNFIKNNLKETFTKILNNDEVLKNYKVKVKYSKLDKRVGNKTVWYHASVILKLRKDNANLPSIENNDIKLDVNYVGMSLEKHKKRVFIDNEYIDALVYDNEKYLANKLMAFNKHMHYYNIDLQKGLMYTDNYDNLEKDYSDIKTILKHLKINELKVDYYLKLMGETVAYKNITELIKIWEEKEQV